MDIAVKELCDVYKGNIDEHFNDQKLSWKPQGIKLLKQSLETVKEN